jgi:hypothetical protein
MELSSQRRDIHESHDSLSTRHCDGGIDQKLERHRRTGSHARPNGENPRVTESAVAQILKYVTVDEGGETDPGNSLRTHGCGWQLRFILVARFEYHHRMAANSDSMNATLGNDGRSIVRAPAAIRRWSTRYGQNVDRNELASDRIFALTVQGQVGYRTSQDAYEAVDGKLAVNRDEGIPDSVSLASDGGGDGCLVKNRANLCFDKGLLLLEHEDLVH